MSDASKMVSIDHSACSDPKQAVSHPHGSCFCVYPCVHVCTRVCTCLCIWTPEVIPQMPSTLYFLRQQSLDGLELANLPVWRGPDIYPSRCPCHRMTSVPHLCLPHLFCFKSVLGIELGSLCLCANILLSRLTIPVSCFPDCHETMNEARLRTFNAPLLPGAAPALLSKAVYAIEQR